MTDGATNAGNIYQGDFDTWTFTATQGDYIALSVGTETQTTAHFEIGRASCRERGELLGDGATENGTSNIAATAPTSGTYTVIIGSYLSGFYDGTLSYLLTLAYELETLVELRRVLVRSMTDGATNAGSIYQGDFDTWTFTATQGDYIALSVGTETQTTAHFAPWIRLVSPTGALLGNSSPRTGAAELAATAPPTRGATVVIG